VQAFTKWLNAKLQAHHGAGNVPVITQLARAFRDGIMLFKLAAALYPDAADVQAAQFNKAPRLRAQQIDNVASALKLIERHGPELRFTQVEQLVDCELKMVLGMVWSVIHHHQIRTVRVGLLHGRDALLLWCKRLAAPLAVDVANFSSSWADGAAVLCVVSALVGADKLPVADLLAADRASRDAMRGHLAHAFDVALQDLGVPQLLACEDLLDVERPDEKTVLAYVSELFSAGAAHGSAAMALTNEPEDGAAELTALLHWQRSEDERLRLAASDSGGSDVDRWRSLAQRRALYVQQWADRACGALDAAAAAKPAKAPLRDARNIVQKQLADIAPLRHLGALVTRLRQNQQGKEDASAADALRRAQAAVERVKARLALDADDPDIAAAAAAAAAATAAASQPPSAAHNPEAKAALAKFNAECGELLGALSVSRSTAHAIVSNASTDGLTSEQRCADLELFERDIGARHAQLLEAALATLRYLTRLDAHSSAQHEEAAVQLRRMCAETDEFINFCAQTQRT
jgi:hypothetical protein